MSNNSKPENKNLIKNKVSNVLDELSSQHESEFIEADMVALFEDIVKFFSGREEDFLNFENMNTDAKQAIYTEIKNLIMLLQKIRGAVDKKVVMEMLSENLMTNLSKDSKKFKSVTNQLSKKEQKDLKHRFAEAILLALHRKTTIICCAK